MPIDQKWTCRDGSRINGQYFPADQACAQVIIAPAMGVPSGFYRRLAAWLADHRIAVVTFDYRDTPGTPMADWGRLDMDAVISGCSDDFPLFLLGHSCGGQLVSLAPNAGRLDGIIFMAAQSGYWAHWSGLGRAGMWLLSRILIPVLARGHYFPARKLGMFPIDVPASVVAQWGDWIRRPRYLFDPANGLDTDACDTLALPAMVCGSDDDGFAPRAAIDALLREYPQVTITARKQLSGNEPGNKSIRHMGYFRDSMQAVLWRPVADWILDTADTPTAFRVGQSS